MRVLRIENFELNDVIDEVVDLSNFYPGYKVQIYFWENGHITHSERMSKNTDIIWRECPLFTYKVESSLIDSELTEEEIAEIKNYQFDFIKNDIFEQAEVWGDIKLQLK